MKSRRLLVGLVAILATMGMAAACTPPDAGGQLPSVNWSFKGTSVKVIKSQDAVYDPIFGLCISLAGCKDEPYLLNIGFRVKVGVPGSAETFVVNNRTSAPQNVGEGTTVNVTEAGSPTVFNGVQPVDLLDLANTNNHLEIVGTYVWASEEDQVGNGVAANSVASFLKDGLNATVATADLSSLDANFIVQLVLDNIGSALGILVQNIPLLGLGDDVLGGAMYVGIGAHGTLGSAIDAVVAGMPFPAVAIPLVELPPDIVGGGLYTMTGSKTFNQTFEGGCGLGTCGIHEWNMLAGPA